MAFVNCDSDAGVSLSSMQVSSMHFHWCKHSAMSISVVSRVHTNVVMLGGGRAATLLSQSSSNAPSASVPMRSDGTKRNPSRSLLSSIVVLAIASESRDAFAVGTCKEKRNKDTHTRASMAKHHIRKHRHKISPWGDTSGEGSNATGVICKQLGEFVPHVSQFLHGLFNILGQLHI